uniref:Uncharacterized protein n=1 Tax=Kalanchoe fedtschenkoi TaxID=63787 RepID=A0A7N0TD69_KALFE
MKKASAAALGLWANDIVSKAVLGQKYTGEGDASEIMGALSRKASELTSAFSFRDFIPALSWLDSVTWFAGRVAKTSGALDTFLNQVIDKHEIQSDNADDLDDMKDFDMFVAGTDTSTSTMEWLMAELARKPSAMKRVQEEIRLVVGDRSKIEELDIARMEYFKCAIKETLRLHSVSTLARVL